MVEGKLQEPTYEVRLRELVEILLSSPETFKDFQRAKLKAVRQLRLNRVPSNLEISSVLSEGAPEWFRDLLKMKPVKTGSGVSVITVVAPIYACPHGRCIYCPGGLPYGTPQSYTGMEQAVIEAEEVSYDPYQQITRKLEKLRNMGHAVDKIELIIIGGTFTATPTTFQRMFIKRCLDALNGVIFPSLETALEMAEKARIHVSGITIETKPDWAKLPIAKELVDMGVTRVELGVQALDDNILRLVNRGHNLTDVVEATADLRDLAFKICYHMMPNLPGSSPIKDLEMMCKLFESEDYRPDMLKIYPTLVLPGTGLEKLWRDGLYTPYSDEDLINVLAEFFRRLPRYVRVNRVQREIPLECAVSGYGVANLRQVVEKRLNGECQCIRCREIGRKARTITRAEISHIRYRAAGGDEWFISLDDAEIDSLIGFVRLRIPGRVVRPELDDAALVRELHVYGAMTPVGDSSTGQTAQHRGFGRRLLQEAERIAAEVYGVSRLAVISGVGVRGYYRRLGYSRFGPYMCKELN